MQKVEPLGLRELQRFADAGFEPLPWDDGLDGGERIASAALCVQQRLTDSPVQPHFVVDRLARGLELFLVTAPGGVEQLANDAVVQIDDFVGDSGRAFDGDRH